MLIAGPGPSQRGCSPVSISAFCPDRLKNVQLGWSQLHEKGDALDTIDVYQIKCDRISTHYRHLSFRWSWYLTEKKIAQNYWFWARHVQFFLCVRTCAHAQKGSFLTTITNNSHKSNTCQQYGGRKSRENERTDDIYLTNWSEILNTYNLHRDKNKNKSINHIKRKSDTRKEKKMKIDTKLLSPNGAEALFCHTKYLCSVLLQ